MKEWVDLVLNLAQLYFMSLESGVYLKKSVHYYRHLLPSVTTIKLIVVPIEMSQSCSSLMITLWLGMTVWDMSALRGRRLMVSLTLRSLVLAAVHKVWTLLWCDTVFLMTDVKSL